MEKSTREPQEEFKKMHERWRLHLKEMSGGGDIRGIEISGAIRMLANGYEHVISHDPASADISGPRMGILLRLMAEKNNGNLAGINPTRLSRYQHVKKNTITSLLRGLEDQGLVERTYDPNDRRAVLICITPAGSEVVRSTAPARLEYMNGLSSALTSEEKDTLLTLLDKLRTSMLSHSCPEATLKPGNKTRR